MQAIVTNIQPYSVHDGPGIRTTVFLKGCTLACRWCSNPECLRPEPEVGFIVALCQRCGRCVSACPKKALSPDAEGWPQRDRSLCCGCGACAAACPYQATVAYGKPMSVAEVWDAVRRDKPFYDASGGGVTVSGGEPLLHYEFVGRLFDRLRDDKIRTCVETAGCAAPAALLHLLPRCDYVLYDLKLMDSAIHCEFTGRPNELILSNARLVAESKVEFLFRMPLIPGINNDAANLKRTATFLQSLGDRATRIELMPYHRMGMGKYAALGRAYGLPGLPAIDAAEVEAARRTFEEQGIQCSVSM